MRHLLLVRHGPAAGKAPGGSDRERPLTPDGRRAVEALAERLGAVPEQALCSTAVRARETLEILIAGRPAPETDLEDALYLADAKSLLGRLRDLPAEARSVLLVGHNPGLHELAAILAGAGAEALAGGLPAAGAVAFDVEGDWRGLGPSTARLRGVYSP